MQESPNVMMRTLHVPGWVYRAIIRHGHSVSDLANYRVLRKILSLDDLAELFYLNDRLRINNEWASETTSTQFFSQLSPEESKEIANSVLPLSGSEQIANSVKNRLTTSTEMQKMANDNCEYQLIPVGSDLFVILNEGFLTACENKDTVFEFIKNYLKNCYFMTSIADVSKKAVFKAYLNHLAV